MQLYTKLSINPFIKCIKSFRNTTEQCSKMFPKLAKETANKLLICKNCESNIQMTYKKMFAPKLEIT